MKIDLKDLFQKELLAEQGKLDESVKSAILNSTIAFYLTHLFVYLYGFSYHRDFEKLQKQLEGLPKDMDGEFKNGLIEILKSSLLSELSDDEKKDADTGTFISGLLKSYSKNLDEIIRSFCQSLNIAITKTKEANKQ